MKRRDFIEKATQTTLLFLGAPTIAQAKHQKLVFSSAKDLITGKNKLVVSQTNGAILKSLPLERRFHSMAYSPQRKEVVFIERRPGYTCHVFSIEKLNFISSFSCPPKRHFYGHGDFTLSGRYLLITMNDLETLNGRIGIFDAHNNYELVKEFSSGGIGPHEIRRSPLSDRFFICNGGVQTHPDTGRKILNPDDMQPSLVTFDHSLSSFTNHALDNSYLSIRHMDINTQDSVLIGVQDKDFIPMESDSLVALHTSSQPLQTLPTDTEIVLRAQGYVASVGLSEDGLWGVSTCPKGDMAILWNLKKRKLEKVFKCPDASGVDFDKKDQSFILTSGTGKIYRLKSMTLTQLGHANVQWDNHNLAINA